MSSSTKLLTCFMVASYLQLFWSMLVFMIYIGSPNIWLRNGNACIAPFTSIITGEDANNSIYFKRTLMFPTVDFTARGNFTWMRNCNNVVYRINPIYMYTTQVVNLILTIISLICVAILHHKNPNVGITNLVFLSLLLCLNVGVLIRYSYFHGNIEIGGYPERFRLGTYFMGYIALMCALIATNSLDADIKYSV